MTADQYLAELIPDMTPAQRELYLDFAETITSIDMYGASYNKALALRAAHWFRTNSLGAGGVITSMKEGDLSIGFSGAKENLASTVFGQMLLDMKRAFGFSIGVTG